jgi:WD40 repeat protein
MNRNKVKAVFIFGILVSILAACSGKVTTVPSPTLAPMVATATLSPVELISVSFTPSATRTPIFTLSPTPDSTQQTWHSTAVAIANTERAMDEQRGAFMETQIAQFSVTCDQLGYSEISPDGNWLAVNCGSKFNQTLIVKSKQGVTWVLKYKDFYIHEHSGQFYTIFWSPEGNYLYFSASMGYSGGGDQCFPQQRGRYGLFLLNLDNGSWTSLVPATETFPGYKIEFSPTGRRYAIDIDGISIADVKSGDIIKLDVPGVMDFNWSPDGKHLAYTVADCGESGLAKSASVYVWDSTTNRIQQLFTLSVEGMVLNLESWMDNSTLRVLAEKQVGLDTFFDVYVYDITKNALIFSGTATPYP